MVSEFTTRNLTYQKDTLPALSGVAYELKHRMAYRNDSYVAGLWLNNLAIGLLWRISTIEQLAVAKVPDGQKNFDRHDFHSPSWSWVSISHRPIEYDLNDQMLPRSDPARNLVKHVATKSSSDVFFSTQILDEHVLPKSSQAPYGAVVEGSIRLIAQLAEITIRLDEPLNNSQSRRAHFEGSNECTDKVPEGFMRKLTMHSAHFQDTPLSRKHKTESFVGDCTLDRIEDLRGGGVDSQSCIRAYFLPLLVYYAENLGWPDYRCMGLAVVRTDTGRCNEYVRIGRASVDMDFQLYFRCSLPIVNLNLI